MKASQFLLYAMMYIPIAGIHTGFENTLLARFLNGNRNRDICTKITNSQYPYNWQGSYIGACVRVMSDQYVTKMVPDSIGGLFLEPRQVRIQGGLSIQSPFGNGTGKWNGRGNVIGPINLIRRTSQNISLFRLGCVFME